MTTLYIICFFAALAGLLKAIGEMQKAQDAKEDRRQMRLAAVRFTERRGVGLASPDL